MGNVLKDKGDLDAAIDSYNQAIKINPDYAEAYSNLGAALKDKGELDAAIDSYKQAIKIKPDYADAYSNLGAALKDKGDLDAAICSYKQALKIKPDYAKVKHLVASLTGETTKAAPREYVEDLFDQYAAKFEHSLIENLQYQTPKIITEMIIKRHPSKALGSVLDLGCGTGLAGLELEQFCEKLDGIDLSESMLRQARAKGVYGKLIHGDIAEHLAEADLDFDYFISTDVFVYVGELSDIFRLIKSRNRRRAKLVFSTEHREGKDFYLEKSGRYSHSKSYIEGLCNKYGYHLSHFEKTKLRKEKSEFLMELCPKVGDGEIRRRFEVA
jgi:predicted TPR repeat methyltransferase